MLVVRRRAGEAIVVAGDVEIEIIEISRTRVKLGITAPREVSVTRREAAVVASENREAAGLLAAGALEPDLLTLLVGQSATMPKTSETGADM
jgi:carbon storage regulator